MGDVRKTPLHDRHLTLGAKMMEFAGWDMPLQYAGGIVSEHLATRRSAGLFDVSHMGRFILRGRGSLAFLQYTLTNDAARLTPGMAQYTMIPNVTGGAIDDAYLYRWTDDEYLLVVNAANRQKDWDHFQSLLPGFGDMELAGVSDELAMISLQGPLSQEILASLIEAGAVPQAKRNCLSTAAIRGAEARIARTGYTGEPLCFELFIENGHVPAVWDALIERGASPVGLGARDTLRLEAGLPLYGHELGTDADGKDIPIFSCPLARFAVSLSDAKGDFIGKPALAQQYDAFTKIVAQDYSSLTNLPQMVRSLAITGKGIARQGAKVSSLNDEPLGYVTSGTMVPYWKMQGEAQRRHPADEHAARPICLAMLDSRIDDQQRVQIEVRSRKVEALTVPYNLQSTVGAYAQPIIY